MLTAIVLAAALNPAFEQVVAAERAFAADSAPKGLHAAFLAHLAPDSVVFQPVPMSGLAAHQDKPPAQGLLSWSPGWAAAAGAGDLGVTSGPWIYKMSGEGAPPPRTGWFFSVWKRQPDGTWKVRADIGITCALDYAVPSLVENGLAEVGPVPPIRRIEASRARARLDADEQRLDAEGRTGLGAAVLARAAEGLRVHREGTCPSMGAAGRELLVKDTRAVDCKPDRIEVSGSGDLGFAYGSCEAVAPAAGKTGYLRVWARQPDGGFKVLADVTLDLPEKK
jgi:ketosteroid isomerase-like protein